LRGSWLEASPGPKVCKTLSQAMAECSGTYLSSQLCEEVQIGESPFRPAGHKGRPCLKNNQSKKGRGYRLSVDQLPSKCEALSSNPSAVKKKNSVS
jgi:hypothetical protein